MKRKIIFRNISRIFLIALFIGISFYFYAYSSPEKLVYFIGVENAYLLIFILAFIGGITTFSGIPYHLVLITLAAGGLNPVFLGTSTAFGVMLGDTTSYYVGYQGSAIIPRSFHRILDTIRNFSLKHPKLLPLLFFLYGCMSPFSNDFIVISMGLSRYPYWKVIAPLGLGNLVFNVSLSYFATEAHELLKGIFF